MHVLFWFTTSCAIVMAILSLANSKQIFLFIDQLRQRHKMVPYMVLMTAWLILLMYGLAWLLWMLHLAGLPVKSAVSFILDFFVIH